MKKVCLVFGGSTSEAEVSKTSAKAFKDALNKLQFEVIELEFSENFIQDILQIKPDVVLNSMHGKYGEDGTLPTILNFLRIPYTHSGRSASILGMNKITTKEIAKNIGIPIINSFIATKQSLLANNFPRFIKSFIKPISEGSTIGCVRLFEKDLTLEDKKIISDTQDNFFIVEEFFEGIEISAGILMEKNIGSVEIAPKSGYYDYKSKYTKGETEYFLPARISLEIAAKIEECALKIHRTIGAKSISRSDFLVNGNDFRFLEINTHPGCTTTSLIPKMAAEKNISFEQIVKFLIDDASFESY